MKIYSLLFNKNLKLALVGIILIKFSSLSAPTKIEELTAGSDVFSSDPAVSSSIFVGAEREENLNKNLVLKYNVKRCQLWKLVASPTPKSSFYEFFAYENFQDYSTFRRDFSHEKVGRSFKLRLACSWRYEAGHSLATRSSKRELTVVCKAFS